MKYSLSFEALTLALIYSTIKFKKKKKSLFTPNHLSTLKDLLFFHIFPLYSFCFILQNFFILYHHFLAYFSVQLSFLGRHAFTGFNSTSASPISYFSSTFLSISQNVQQTSLQYFFKSEYLSAYTVCCKISSICVKHFLTSRDEVK